MTFPTLQTEGRTQPRPALGQETGSSAGSRWAPLRSPCAKVWGGASWPCAPPRPQTACEERRRRRRKAGHGCPAQVRGETVRQAAEPVPRGCGSVPDPLRGAALWERPGGNHLPGDTASIQQPGQALCLKLSNPILGLCTKLSILLKKKKRHKKVVVFFCMQAMGGNVFLNRHYKLLNSRPFHQMHWSVCNMLKNQSYWGICKWHLPSFISTTVSFSWWAPFWGQNPK